MAENIRTDSTSSGYTWTVQIKTLGNGQERYRYHCRHCGHNGAWKINPNDADGDNHLYAKHGEGE